MEQSRNLHSEDSYEEIRVAYFEWLCELVASKRQARRYSKLLRVLHKKPFFGFVPNDDNREEDGKKLRERFSDEMLDRNDCVCLDGPCSVLEMMIALAIRIDGIMGNPSKPNEYASWFWEMIRNLDLDWYYNGRNFTDAALVRIDVVLTKLIERRYYPTGRGGLFPLVHANKNQRDVEIWYQMMAYLEENHAD